MSPRLKRAIFARALPLAFALAFPCLAIPAASEEIHVKIDNFVFTPDTIAVKPGDIVIWENGDDIPHSIVSSKAGAFRSKVLDTDEKFSFTFTAAGTFEYFCGLHPHMKGKVVAAP